MTCGNLSAEAICDPEFETYQTQLPSHRTFLTKNTRVSVSSKKKERVRVMKPNMMKKVIAIVVLQMAILYYLVSAGACCPAELQHSGGHGQNPADLAVRVTTPNQDNLARDRDTQNLAVLQTQHREEADALNRADAILAGEPAPSGSNNWRFKRIVVHEKRERPRLTEVLKNLAGASDPRRETDALSRTD
ncbi:hypothetical protein SeMB42_g07344 [Synchytrium endobioticum]|uniref:Uncharacterized protein n=1 Tax=Synchytrium endobioticum TaxID=286115 RepID=A0A507C3M2_9FUNG|nr:hypothetical protein SeMB42_g07344 [Synchytrium endobioticum]